MTSHYSSSVAADYYQKFASANFVTKASGTLIENPQLVQNVLRAQQTFMQHDIGCVLVHGGGKQLSRALKGSQMHPETHLRITPKEAIPILERELQQISASIAEACNKLGIEYKVLPHSITHAERRLGHGETGKVYGVDGDAVSDVVQRKKLAIVPFGGVDRAGSTLNVNADEVGCQVAASVEAMKLIFLTNEDGIMVPGRNGKKLRKNFLDIHRLILLLRKKDSDGRLIIGEGMIPKVEACIQALTSGVEQVHMLKPSLGAILDEMLTHTGSGTLIEKHQPIELIFPATERHLNGIETVRAECSTEEYRTPQSHVPYLKPVSRERLEELLPETLVIEHRGTVVASCYFKTLEGQANTALLGGMVVGENNQDSDYGRALLEAALEQIQSAGFTQAVSITASKPMMSLFDHLGEAGVKEEWHNTLLNKTKERYGSDQDLVEFYTFNTGNL